MKNTLLTTLMAAAICCMTTFTMAGQVWDKPENVKAICNAKAFLDSMTTVTNTKPIRLVNALGTVYEYASTVVTTNDAGKVMTDRLVSWDRSYEPPAAVWEMLESYAGANHQKQIELKHLKNHERFWKYTMDIQECIYWLVDANPYDGYEPYAWNDPSDIKKRILNLSKDVLLKHHINSGTMISTEILEREFTSIRDALDAPCCEGIERVFKNFGLEFDFDLTNTRKQMKQLETEYKLKTLKGNTACKNRLMIILGLEKYNEFVKQISK